MDVVQGLKDKLEELEILNEMRWKRAQEELAAVEKEFMQVAGDMGDYDADALVETIDEIEEWLDENTDIGENEHWCWSDGDFGLWLFDEDGEHAE